MDKNQIFITSGTEYKKMTKELLEKADLQSHIGDRKKKIGIKPNLVSPSEASWGATTHPEVVAGIIEYLKEHGFRDMVMLEGSWVGDKTREAFETCGFDRLEEEYQVPFWDMQKDKGVPVDCGGMELNVCERVKELDFLINVPVLKGHCQTKITCALKNMKGLIPNKEKRRFHSLGLHKPIAYLNMGIKQDFIVVDNICGDLDFEDGGNPVVMNRVIAACDPVLVDAYVCQMMHYEVADVPYVKLAGELGVGCPDVSKADVQFLADQALYLQELVFFAPAYGTDRAEDMLEEIYEETGLVGSCSGYEKLPLYLADRQQYEHSMMGGDAENVEQLVILDENGEIPTVFSGAFYIAAYPSCTKRKIRRLQECGMCCKTLRKYLDSTFLSGL